MQKWQDILPLIEAERGASANPVFIDALDACLTIIGQEDPDLTLNEARSFIVEIEDRINYLIYQTTDILKTNALMECADMIRDYARESIQDYREGDDF
jgi:hypothetical protein